MGSRPGEAASLASAYRLTAEQFPMNERAKREGEKSTIDAAIRAYREYNYLLANQLMIAATRQGIGP